MSGQWTLILAAVVLGWVAQLYFSYRQSMSFTTESRRLRQSGTVSVGAGGRRYRGGRAFVAIAAEGGVVRDAISLSGFTTMARAKALPQLVGLRVNRLSGDRDIDGLTRAQREAARQAATLMRSPSTHAGSTKAGARA